MTATQHNAPTLDVDLPRGFALRVLPAPLLGATVLVWLNAVLAVVESSFGVVLQSAATTAAVLAAALTPVMLLGRRWGRWAVTVLLGAHIVAATVEVLLTPDPHHGRLALRAVLWSAVTVILMFRERVNAYYAMRA